MGINFLKSSFFSIKIFFHGHWRITGQQGKGGNHLLFHSVTSTRSQKSRYLFATLHVRWLSHIFNRTACIYKTATRWDFADYRITIWLIDDMTLVFCLFTWWIDSSFFVTAIWGRRPADSNSHWLLRLYYKRTDFPSVLATSSLLTAFFLVESTEQKSKKD